MNARLQEFFQDLTIFFTDLASICNRKTMPNALGGYWKNVRQDSYRKIPLVLTVSVHLAVLLFSIAAPFIMSAKNRKIPEVYTVNLYNIPETAPPPVRKVVKLTTPVQKKAVAPKPVKSNAVSLSPIRQKLAKERKEKEEKKRQKKIQMQKLEQVKLNLLKEQAENEAIRAEKELAEAKKDAATKIADLYKSSDYASSISKKSAADSNGTSKKQGEIDRRKLEALDIYRSRITDHISPFWQLPELQGWDENLRAVIVMQVKRDGTVTNSYFEKRSKNLRFNQYAQKAIDNANPLPPFPIDFHDKSEEIAVTFSPGGLF